MTVVTFEKDLFLYSQSQTIGNKKQEDMDNKAEYLVDNSGTNHFHIDVNSSSNSHTCSSPTLSNGSMDSDAMESMLGDVDEIHSTSPSNKLRLSQMTLLSMNTSSKFVKLRTLHHGDISLPVETIRTNYDIKTLLSSGSLLQPEDIRLVRGGKELKDLDKFDISEYQTKDAPKLFALLKTSTKTT